MTTTRKYLPLLAGLLLATQVGAQDDFRKWQSAQQQQFTNYLSQQDKAFLAHLEAQWKSFDAFRGVVRDPVPKPTRPLTAPKSGPAPRPKTSPVALQPPPKTPPVPQPDPAPSPATPPVVLQPAPPKPPAVPQPDPAPRPGPDSLALAFFGSTITLPRLPALPVTEPNQAGIRAFWQAAASAPTAPLVSALDSWRQTNNDWALLQLLRTYSQAVYPASRNQQALTEWFLLTRLGYRAKVGIASGRILLYLPLRQMVYSRPYLQFDQQRYFIGLLEPEKDVGALYSYEGEHPDAVRILNLDADRTTLPAPLWKQRELSFSFAGKPYRLTVNYDANKIDFLATYPQTDLDFYFRSAPAGRTAEELLTQLRPIVRAMDERTAANFLLRLTQTAFQYKTDGDNFGFENYLFVDEVLHHPYSDCEDRSIFYAWLVSSLLDNEVIGLLYPGHVATAVRFREPLADGKVVWQGRTFNVADPTYINADAGMVMPQFIGKSPEVISTLSSTASR